MQYVISKSELEHGVAYLGVAGVATWDARQQQFHTFSKLPTGAIVQTKLRHAEDADEGFEPVSAVGEHA